mmetsp:Transcript_97706/g.142987  ORF Transcript_97706/g.142987 Transcript_97706/m.142987 type:complete len:404 (-) Transcript_97706:918-2129(-)
MLILVVVLVAAFLITELGRYTASAELSGKFLQYFCVGPLNWVKSAQIIVFAVIFGLWIAIVLDPVRNTLVVSLQEINSLNGEPPNFNGLIVLSRAYFFACGLQIMLCLLRTVAFLEINYTLAKLTKTFSFIQYNILLFVLVLFILFVGFFVAGHLMFGDKIMAFATLAMSLSTVLNGMANGIEYSMLADANELAAPIFFYPFILIMLFVVLNITIAIILEGYSQAQDEREENEHSDLADLCNYHILNQIYRGATRRLTYFRPLYVTCLRPLLSAWAWKRLEDRYTKAEILVILRGLETNDCIDFYELERHLDEHFHDQLSSEQIVDIVTSQNAWVSEVEVRARGLAVEGIAVARKAVRNSYISRPVEDLQESLEMMAKEKHELQSKLEKILRLVPASSAQQTI